MKYTAPEMNIVKFEAMEVIVASGLVGCTEDRGPIQEED